MTFTRHCLSNKKVRHELGQTSANEALERLQVQYNSLTSAAERQGLNAGVFDVSIPVTR